MTTQSSHGRKTKLSIATADVSPWTNASEFGRGADAAETTAYGSEGHEFGNEDNLKAHTFTCSGWYDVTETTGTEAVLGGQEGQVLAIEYGPEGSASGKPKHTFSAQLSKFTLSSPVADIVKWSADWKVSGDVTTGAYS